MTHQQKYYDVIEKITSLKSKYQKELLELQALKKQVVIDHFTEVTGIRIGDVVKHEQLMSEVNEETKELSLYKETTYVKITDMEVVYDYDGALGKVLNLIGKDVEMLEEINYKPEHWWVYYCISPIGFNMKDYKGILM